MAGQGWLEYETAPEYPPAPFFVRL